MTMFLQVGVCATKSKFYRSFIKSPFAFHPQCTRIFILLILSFGIFARLMTSEKHREPKPDLKNHCETRRRLSAFLINFLCYFVHFLFTLARNVFKINFQQHFSRFTLVECAPQNYHISTWSSYILENMIRTEILPSLKRIKLYL